MEELAEVMEITEQEAEQLVQFNTRSLSTDQPLGNDQKTSLRDLLKSDDSRPEAQIMKESLTDQAGAEDNSEEGGENYRILFWDRYGSPTHS